MLASIIIPAYNCGPWLTRATTSAYNLGEELVEVIVVDDGSSDNTPSKCMELKARYPSLRVIRQENGGLSVARNRGIYAASGTFIVLLDADDELLPLDLPKLLNPAHDVVRFGVEEVDDRGTKRLHTEPPGCMTGEEYVNDRMSKECFYTPSCAYAYRREWLLDHRITFFPKLIHEDNLFTVQALLKAASVKVCDALLYRYIRRGGSITLAINEAQFRRRIESLGIIAHELTKLAQTYRGVDLRWWIDEAVHNAAVLAQQCSGMSPRLRVLLMQFRFMATYRGFGAPAVRWQQRQRLKKLLLGYPRAPAR